ncbi:diguanylate cyclase [Litoribrevibacter euphylliae]|uniref:diguanylate cyclase n=1 Tax=Litoribrevibacter euphylliae TaxID=1834034 RepID=A0ABV7HG67_9GAMM
MNSLHIPADTLDSWQDSANLVAQLMQVSACMITAVTKKTCTVRVINKSKDNPFLLKERLPFNKDDLCRRVVDSNKTVYIEALEASNDNHNMRCYLGKPIHWPDGQVFGTLSVMDTQPREFTSELMVVFDHMSNVIENQLALVHEQDQHEHTQIALDRYQQQYKEFTSRDPLTGAYNRRALQELAIAELSRTTRRSGCFALALLDVDHFKQINDEYGNTVGDAVLKHLVISLDDMLRQSDFVARFGGEEFCLLLPEMDASKAYEILERIRKKLCSKAVEYNGHSIYYTASIGVALFETGMITTVEELLNMAEGALSEAKSSGRNKVVVATIDTQEQAMYSAF